MIAPQARPTERDWRVLQAMLLASDALALLLAFYAAFMLRLIGPWAVLEPRNVETYVNSAVLIVPLWLAIFAARGLYRRRLLLGGPREYSAAFNALVYGVVAVALLVFIWDWGISRVWLALGSLLALAFVELGRFAVRRVGYRLRERGWFIHELLIVGASHDGRAIAEQLNNPSRTGVRVLGFLDDYLPIGTEVLPGLTVVARPRNSDGEMYCPDGAELVVIPQALSWETLQTLVYRGMAGSLNERIKLAAGFYEILASGVHVEQYARVPLFSINRVSITGAYAVAKSIMDVTIAAALLVPGLPMMGLMWLCCRLSGVKPVWRKDELMGCTRRPFVLRRLNMPAILEQGKPWLVGLASRLGMSRVPGLFNVLRRDISLVGPAAHPLEAADEIEEWLPSLLSVRPGLWSLSSGADSLPDQVKQDLYYVRNFSLTLDLQIISKRLWATFKRSERRRPGHIRLQPKAEVLPALLPSIPDAVPEAKVS